MSIRTTVTLDDDIVQLLTHESQAKGLPFGKLLNEMIRAGLLARHAQPNRPPHEIKSADMGTLPGVNYDNVFLLIERLEGNSWR
jgi:hypothetical protein